MNTQFSPLAMASLSDFSDPAATRATLATMRNWSDPKGGKTIRDLRAIVGADDARTTAVAECAKLGIVMPDLGEMQTKDRKTVAECRRAINRLASAASASSTDADGRKRLLTAIEWIGASLAIDDQQTALDADAKEAWVKVLGQPSPSADAIRDHDGRRIGVRLTADDLRDADKIAAKLGTRDRTPHMGDGFLGTESGSASLGTFFRAVAGGPVSDGAIKASLSEGVDTSGGYAVPSVLLPDILQALSAASATLSAGAEVAVLTEPGKSYRIAAIDTLPTAGWRKELGTIATSDAGFRAVDIVPKSLAVIVKISRELLADGTGVEQAIRTALAQSFAAAIDSAALNGSGTDPEPRGILKASGISTVDLGTNGAALASYAPFIKARRVLADAAAPEPTAVIVANRDMETLDGLVDSLGQPLRRPDALAGLRFVPTPRLPINQTHGTATAASSMIVADFSTVMVALREQLSVQLLRETYAATGELAFLAHARVDVALTYPKAVAVIAGVIPSV